MRVKDLNLFKQNPWKRFTKLIATRYQKLVAYPEQMSGMSGGSIVIASSGLSSSINSYTLWKEEMKEKYPLRHFFNTTLYHAACRWRTTIREAIWWVRYRTINRNHVLTMHALGPGWHDRDRRMLYACFQLLVDFVEIELARANYAYPSKGHRDPVAGLKHLEWEIEHCTSGMAPTQAASAQIKKDLYLWWTKERPKRVDPWDWDMIWTGDQIDDTKAGDQAQYLEELYDREDNDMLAKLIAIRKTLWT